MSKLLNYIFIYRNDRITFYSLLHDASYITNNHTFVSAKKSLTTLYLCKYYYIGKSRLLRANFF